LHTRFVVLLELAILSRPSKEDGQKPEPRTAPNLRLAKGYFGRQSRGMENNWASENLQVIRTLMERSTLYRLALAPITLLTGVVGVAAAALGWLLRIGTPRGFVGYWMGVSVVCLLGAYLLARRQALRESEPFWSPPTRRVSQALLPPLFIGMISGLLTLVSPGWDVLPAWALPSFWMLLYGCALHAAGFFMARGIRWFGWLFILAGSAFLTARAAGGAPPGLVNAHAIMGIAFGGLHLAYGTYLYFTEKRSP